MYHAPKPSEDKQNSPYGVIYNANTRIVRAREEIYEEGVNSATSTMEKLSVGDNAYGETRRESKGGGISRSVNAPSFRGKAPSAGTHDDQQAGYLDFEGQGQDESVEMYGDVPSAGQRGAGGPPLLTEGMYLGEGAVNEDGSIAGYGDTVSVADGSVHAYGESGPPPPRPGPHPGMRRASGGSSVRDKLPTPKDRSAGKGDTLDELEGYGDVDHGPRAVNVAFDGSDSYAEAGGLYTDVGGGVAPGGAPSMPHVIQTLPPGASMGYPGGMGHPGAMHPAMMGGMHPGMMAGMAQNFDPKVISPEEADVMEEPWYYRNVNRQDAEAMLGQEVPGCFVVRPGRQQGTFVLSLRTGDQFSHLQITPRYTQGLRGQRIVTWVLGEFSKQHQSVRQLVEYHRRNQIEIVGKPWVCLRDPQKF